MSFLQWQNDRGAQGAFAHTVRTLYSSGHSYHDALEMFRICYLAEASLDCHGNLTLAAEELQMSRFTMLKHLKRAGFGVKEIRGMPKETRISGRPR